MIVFLLLQACVFRTLAEIKVVGAPSNASLSSPTSAPLSPLTTIGMFLTSYHDTCSHVKWTKAFIKYSSGNRDGISLALYEQSPSFDPPSEGTLPLASVSAQTLADTTSDWQSFDITDTYSAAPDDFQGLYAFYGRPSGSLPAVVLRSTLNGGIASNEAAHDIASDFPLDTSMLTTDEQVALYWEYDCCYWGHDSFTCRACTEYGVAACPVGQTSTCCEGSLHDCQAGFVDAAIAQSCPFGCGPGLDECYCSDCDYGCNDAGDPPYCYSECSIGSECQGNLRNAYTCCTRSGNTYSVRCDSDGLIDSRLRCDDGEDGSEICEVPAGSESGGGSEHLCKVPAKSNIGIIVGATFGAFGVVCCLLMMAVGVFFTIKEKNKVSKMTPAEKEAYKEKKRQQDDYFD